MARSKTTPAAAPTEPRSLHRGFVPESWLSAEEVAVLRDPATPPQELKRRFDEAVANEGGKVTDKDRSPFYAVFFLVAQNPNTPVSILATLLTFAEGNHALGEAVGTNPALPLLSLSGELSQGFWTRVVSHLWLPLRVSITKRRLQNPKMWDKVVELWPKTPVGVALLSMAKQSVNSPIDQSPQVALLQRLSDATDRGQETVRIYVALMRHLRKAMNVPIQSSWENLFP